MSEKHTCPLDNLDPQSFLIECFRENHIHWPGSKPEVAEQMAQRYAKSFCGATEPFGFRWMWERATKYLHTALKKLGDGHELGASNA